ncbi:MAG: glycosyltransferase family 2 protein [Bacteroidia bacterium]|nr:glycosyltransferase family 2 protein [Bacteroidia bacterium]MCX7764671.1 glycosyltransferase family 2 protein [Bacteroidia bacterium]MDW8057639.1 glycosyltransferase family 2 protein [Bacteroidia bacterium]
MELSLVIPAYNEAESLPELIEWIYRVCEGRFPSYELIVVDDGSTDGTWQVLESLRQKYPFLRAVRFVRNYGKSAALYVGFQKAQGKVIITLDADLQDSPDEIPALYEMIVQGGYDLVSGWKKKRHDPLSKRLPSRVFNAVVRVFSGIPLHDFNSGIKAYRAPVAKSIELYGEMHRYIPYLAKANGFRKIGEKIVTHYPRKYGHTKFGWERFLYGFLDLLTVSFLARFGRRPMHFFGGLGVLAFFLGAGIVLWLISDKLHQLRVYGTVRREVVQQPLFYLGLTVLVVGVQLFLAGFLGELILRQSPTRDNYIISAEL